VPAAVDVAFAEEVDEIGKQLGARAAREARRVPGGVGAGAVRKHGHLACRQHTVTAATAKARASRLLLCRQQLQFVDDVYFIML
jgi:hypothetical protein